MLHDRAVINSGPLVALSLAGRLDLLPALLTSSESQSRFFMRLFWPAWADPVLER